MARRLDEAIDQFSQLSIRRTTNNDDDLDPNWLIPRRDEKGFSFRCSISLQELIDQELSEIYFKRLMSIVEEEEEIMDFHMVLRHEDRFRLIVGIVFKGDHQPRSGPVQTDLCISCDTENPLSRSSLLEDNPKTRIWLDGQLREKFIVTPRRHIERLSEMTRAERTAFWFDAQSFLSRNRCHWKSIVINHGTYCQHAHLHMKINIYHQAWENRIKHRYKNKLRQMDQLLNQSGENATEQYFGHRQFNQWSGIRQFGNRHT